MMGFITSHHPHLAVVGLRSNGHILLYLNFFKLPEATMLEQSKTHYNSLKNILQKKKKIQSMVYFTNLRRSFSLSNLLLSSLNLLILFLSSASFVPIFLFRTSPTSFGWALVTVSATTLLSSLVGFYSQLTHLCFITHVSLVLASSVGQVLGFLSLFLRHDSSLRLLGSVRSPKEQWVLLVLEEMLLLAMFVMQSVALVLTCVVEKRWAREYEEVEAEREAAARKRSWRMTRVQEEAMANAAAMAEVKGRELDEKMKAKYGQRAKNEFAEC